MKLANYSLYCMLIFFAVLSLLFIQAKPVFCIDSPVVTNTQATEAYENEDYSWKAMISGGTAPFTCNFTGALPSWLVLDSSTCSVSGKLPRGLSTDSVSFGIRVADSSTPPLTANATISIPLRYKSTISLTTALSDNQTNVYIDGQLTDKISGVNKIIKVFVNKKISEHLYQARDENYNIIYLKCGKENFGKEAEARIINIGVHNLIGEIIEKP